MPQQKRPLERDTGQLRDCSLVVVASEDTHAPKQYFERFKARRIKYIVLPTEGGHSSPRALIERLDEFRKDTEFQENDQFWACPDRDHWTPQNLSEFMQQCRSKGYSVAMSNPCFDLWILLHFHDKELPMPLSCRDVRTLLIEHHGGYNKAKCCGALPFTPELVRRAIERAKELDNGNPISDQPSTGIYRLVELLLTRDAIRLADLQETELHGE